MSEISLFGELRGEESGDSGESGELFERVGRGLLVKACRPGVAGALISAVVLDSTSSLTVMPCESLV